MNKYILDSSRTLDYFSERIDAGNILSRTLLETVDLNCGVFYTLVPEGADLERLYEFKYGGLLPQNPIIKYLNDDGKISSYSRIPTIDVELSQLIFNVLQNNTGCCLFDDVVCGPADRPLHGLIDIYKYVSGSEGYYLLNQEDATAENIRFCLESSNAFWHSLCVFLSAIIRPKNRILPESMCWELCVYVQLILVGAYDREGYLFWERKGLDLFGRYVQSHSGGTQWGQLKNFK